MTVDGLHNEGQKHDIDPHEDEKRLSCYFFLNDINAYLAGIQDTWTKVKEKKIPLAIGAQVTQLALDFVRRAVEEFEDGLQHEAGKNYGSNLFMFFQEVLGDAWQQHPGSSVATTDLGLSQAWQILRCPDLVQVTNGRIDDILQICEGHGFPFPVKHTPKACSAGHSSGCSLVGEYLLMSRVPSAPVAEQGVWTDGISEGFQMFGQDCPVPSLYAVFTVQALLDIHETLSDSGLAASAAEMHGILEHIKRVRASVMPVIHQMLPSSDHSRAFCVQELQKKDRIFRAREHFCRNGIQNYVFERNPLSAGLACFQLLHHFNAWGTTVADPFGNPLKALHLYNAVKQENMLEVPWPDLDFLIDMHTSEHLFVGGFPRPGDNYCGRVLMACGGSVITGSVNLGRARYFSLQLTQLVQLLAMRNFLRPSERDVYQDEELQLVAVALNKYGLSSKRVTMSREIKVNLPDLRKLLVKEDINKPQNTLVEVEKSLRAVWPIMLFDYAGLNCRLYLIQQRPLGSILHRVVPITYWSKHTRQIQDQQMAFDRVFDDLGLFFWTLHFLHSINAGSKRIGVNREIYMKSLGIISKVLWADIVEAGSLSLEYVKQSLPELAMKTVDFGMDSNENKKESPKQRLRELSPGTGADISV